MEKKQKRINSLNLLKFLAMFMIVWWHVGKASGVIDWGARMCEFLFVASGFLVGYNYFYKGMDSNWKTSFDYTHKKVRKFWPLHIIALILFMVIHFGQCISNFGWSDLPILLSNIFLLQAWSPNSKVYFSYNGLSWFLSALVFCYFITPLIIKVVKNKKISIILFFLVAATRFFIEFGITKGVNLFDFRVHTSPIVRFLEYFMGMLMVPVFMELKSKLDNLSEKKWFRWLWTVVEFVAISLVIFLMYRFNGSWLRAYYIYVFCIFVFIISMDCGFFSKFCSLKPISYICGFQLEVYIFQVVVSHFVNLWGLQIDFWAIFSIKILILFALSVVYKLFIEERMAKIMDKLYNKIKNLFKNNESDEDFLDKGDKIDTGNKG